MEWYKFRTSQWYRHTRGMNPTEKAEFMDKTVDALEDERMGATPLADGMIEEAKAFSDKQRKRIEARWKREAEQDATAYHGIPRNTAEYHGIPQNTTEYHNQHTNIPTDKQTIQNQPTNPTNPTQPRGRAKEEQAQNSPPARVGVGVGVGVGKKSLDGVGKPLGMDGIRESIVAGMFESPKTAVWEITDSMLPELAVFYFKPAKPKASRKGFVDMLHALGGDLFRRELGRFIAEAEQGEMEGVENWGGCFMERLKKLNGENHGDKKNRTSKYGNGPRIDAAAYVDDPFS